DVCLIAAQDQPGFAPHLKSGVDARDQALCARLFVASGSVQLTCAEEPLDESSFQARKELRRIGKIVFNRIPRPHDLCSLESMDGPHHRDLDIERQTS